MRQVKVALAFSIGGTHRDRIAQGLVKYARERGNWTFASSPETAILSLKDLKGWPGDGVVATISTRAQERAAQQLGLPVVNVLGSLHRAKVPRVTEDQLVVGRLAAEHLLDRGFQRFGYYGLRNVWYAFERGRGFIERVEQEGRICSVLEAVSSISHRGAWYARGEELECWLKTLEPPVGVMASHDRRAQLVVEACAAIGLRVPQDVAVIGTNNDEIICDFSSVPLTSVSLNGEEIGYQAACMLDQLMAGKRLPEHEVLIRPNGVVTRRSTEVMAIEDEYVAKAVHFIEENIGESFGVEMLMRRMPFSRRWFEHRFRRCLNCTPYEYICRKRIERAKQLLAEPKKQTLSTIAEACGFCDAKNFRLVFQRITGMTPTDYRLSLVPPANSVRR